MQIYSWTRAAATISLAGALLVTVGCGLSNGKTAKNDPPAPTTYAYVSGGTGGGIAQFQVTSDGTLAPLSPATIAPPTPYGLGFLTVDPLDQFLFASGIVSNPMVTNQYLIGSDGTLTANSTPTVNGGNSTNPFIFAPNGQLVVIPSVYNKTVNTYSLSSSGTLELIDTVSVNDYPISAAVDPSGRFLYVSTDSSIILEYALSASGELTALGPGFVVAAGFGDLQVSPAGFLYAVNGGGIEDGGGTITAFWIDPSTGQLANAGSFPSGTGSGGEPTWIAFDPTGAYAYVTNLADSSVSQFTVNATTGALSMNGPDVPAGRWPLQVSLDPSGKFAYVVNGGDATISQFTISNTGTLVPNGTLALGVPYGGIAIAFAQR
jgi:6-phosphogluconolactonase